MSGNYKLEVTFDLTKDAYGLDVRDFPATYETPGLQIRPGHGHFILPHGVSAPYQELEARFKEELLLEWLNLVLNNDLRGQKVKLTLNAEVL